MGDYLSDYNAIKRRIAQLQSRQQEIIRHKYTYSSLIGKEEMRMNDRIIAHLKNDLKEEELKIQQNDSKIQKIDNEEVKNVEQNDIKEVNSEKWQNPSADQDARKRIIQDIVGLIKGRKPGPSKEWLAKLPDMARRLEDKLYRQAESFSIYQDPTTLAARLRQIASEFSEEKN